MNERNLVLIALKVISSSSCRDKLSVADLAGMK